MREQTPINTSDVRQALTHILDNTGGFDGLNTFLDNYAAKNKKAERYLEQILLDRYMLDAEDQNTIFDMLLKADDMPRVYKALLAMGRQGTVVQKRAVIMPSDIKQIIEQAETQAKQGGK